MNIRLAPIATVLLLLAACGEAPRAPAPASRGAAADSARGSSGASSIPERIQIEDMRDLFDAYGVHGCFVLYDPETATRVMYDSARCRTRFLPASTFKIMNSLISLETGVIADENVVIPWDGVRRMSPDWNRDHTMRSAFAVSAVWFYQILARRVGAERMRSWLQRVGYGNADISGGIDRFWLNGALRISPAEQVAFLQRLHDDRLPFSQRSMRIVRSIMLREDTLGYRLSAKTGWGATEKGADLGWFVGWVEHGEHTVYFAANIECADMSNKRFLEARTAIARNALRRLGYLPGV